jgi:hypothetical protein
MKRLAISLLVLASLAFAPAAMASPGSATGFTGLWTATDVDGSAMMLRIGVGDQPRVTFQDSYASSCDNAGSPSTRWVGAGTGSYSEIWLSVTFNKTGCGTYQKRSPVELQFYWDEGTDTLWEDEDGDGVGILWYRAA